MNQDSLTERFAIIYYQILIPLSRNIHIQILQTDFCAFPLRICLENLMKDLRFFPLLIILVSLVTFSLDYGMDIIEGKLMLVT